MGHAGTEKVIKYTEFEKLVKKYGDDNEALRHLGIGLVPYRDEWVKEQYYETTCFYTYVTDEVAVKTPSGYKVKCNDGKLRWFEDYLKLCGKDVYDDGFYALTLNGLVAPEKLPKAVEELLVRKQKELDKYTEYKEKHMPNQVKAQFIGCKGCGSKMAKEYVNGTSCPLCGAELRSKTTLDTLERYKKNAEELQARYDKEVEKRSKVERMTWVSARWNEDTYEELAYGY